jgi:hypothetical protein
MSIIFITNKEYQHPIIYYGTDPKNLDNKAIPTNHTYSIGHLPFKGVIYSGVMINLKPDTTYYYIGTLPPLI